MASLPDGPKVCVRGDHAKGTYVTSMGHNSDTLLCDVVDADYPEEANPKTVAGRIGW